MNSVYTDLFKCLCLDLGWSLEAIPTLQERGDARKGLVRVTEISGDPSGSEECQSAWRDVVKTISQWAYPDRIPIRFEDNSEVLAYFKQAYQLLSFELRKPEPVTTEKEAKYVSQFLETEEKTARYRVDPSNWVSRCARSILRRGLVRLDLSVESVARHYRHGPGAVLDGSRGVDKNLLDNPEHDLALSYPYDTFFCNEGFWAEHAKEVLGSSMGHSMPWRKRHVECRLSLVPKDYRGPRGVFISSKEAMMCQLGQAECLIKAVRGSWFSECYDPGSQQPSQACVLSGCINDLPCATLDLSEASDRIPLSLVSYLFSRSDYVALARTRPSYVWLPDPEKGEVRHRMAMFAPMGDGKTFQVLSIVCCALAVAAVMVAEGWAPGRNISVQEIRRTARNVRVYGDDIIVAAPYYSAVVTALEAHNLKVNLQKSFRNGLFREACGYDVLFGHLVTPIRNSRFLDLSANLEAVDLPRACALHRAIAIRFGEMSRSALYLENLVLRKWRRPPWTSEADGEGLYTQDPRRRYRELGYARRLNFNLQIMEAKTVKYRGIHYPPSLDPWWDLNYALLPKERALLHAVEWYRKGANAEVNGSYEAYSLYSLELRRMAKMLRRSLPRSLVYAQPHDAVVHQWSPFW